MINFPLHSVFQFEPRFVILWKVFAALSHLTFNLKVRGHKIPEIRDFLHHSIRHCLHVPLTALSPSVVQLLQVIAAVSRVVVGLVHQVAVPTVSGLPQQVLLKSRLLNEDYKKKRDICRKISNYKSVNNDFVLNLYHWEIKNFHYYYY